MERATETDDFKCCYTELVKCPIEAQQFFECCAAKVFDFIQRGLSKLVLEEEPFELFDALRVSRGLFKHVKPPSPFDIEPPSFQKLRESTT